ncbi:MAG: response regulator [Deltaproteobacteria bacterium]|nr:response regulator [Deltaproteobacteria bacterium]
MDGALGQASAPAFGTLGLVSLLVMIAVATLGYLWFRRLKNELEARTRQLQHELEERQRAEAEHRRLEEQLQRAQKLEAIGQLAGGIAHDFNNLLTAILGNAELLRLHKGQVADAREEIDEILSAGRRGAELVRQLLSFARKGTGQPIPVDVNALVADTASLLRRGTTPNMFVHTELCDEPLVIEADAALIENALLNLGINARDAMPEGGELTFTTRRVVVDAHSSDHLAGLPHGTWVEISVNDTGTGMTEDVKAHLFEPFFTTKSPGKGTGLGLASVYGTVKAHDGQIGVASEPGRGSQFSLYFPLVDDQPAQAIELEPSGLPRRPAHILLVDDDDAARNVVKRMLTELGCTVSTAVDGLEALEFFGAQRRDVDLVLLDMQMPNLDGRATFRELRKIDPRVRVLIMSGYAAKDEAERCLAEGALDFLSKPFKLEDLSRAIGRYGRLPRSPGLRVTTPT